MAGYLKSKALRGRLPEAVAQAAQAESQSVYTSLPGRIVSFDPATQTATVKPLYKAKFNGVATEMPELLDVPVMMPRGGGFAFTFPIKPGDGVQLQFQSRNADLWFNDGGEQEAFSARTNDLSDAVAIPGLEPGPRVISDYNADSLEIRSVDGTTKIELTSDGKIALESAGEELVNILDEFMAVMESHTNDGLAHDQAGAVAALRGRLTALKRT
jgi:hypothetical protein